MNSVKYGPTEKRLKDRKDKGLNIIYTVSKIKVSNLYNNENIFI